MAVIESARLVKTLHPDLNEISKLKARRLIVTAKGNCADFVSRFFAPQSGIDEDPVTGSAHTSLLPLWSKKFAKTKLIANQLSERSGHLLYEFKDDRYMIGGKTRLYLTGEINLD